jgi:hypothetical protein
MVNISYAVKRDVPSGIRSVQPPGEPLHEMLVRITVDDAMTVVAIEAASDYTPHGTCGAIIPHFQRLVGQSMGPGWTKRVKSLIGGAEGCAHHIEVMKLLATVAFQTMGPILARERQEAGIPVKSNSASFLIDSCHVWRADGEWARQFFADPEGTLGGRQIPIEPV